MKVVWDVDGPLRDMSRFKKEAMLRAGERLGFKDYVERYDDKTVWKSYGLAQLLARRGWGRGFEAWIGLFWGHAEKGLDIRETLSHPQPEKIVEKVVKRPPKEVVKELQDYVHSKLEEGEKVKNIEEALELFPNLGIITASQPGNIPRWLKRHGLWNYFRESEIIEGVENKAEAMLRLAQRYGSYIYVGDSHSDLEDVIEVNKYVPLYMVLVDGMALEGKVRELLENNDFKNLVFAPNAYEGLLRIKNILKS
ncbi:MAG: HAD family hydrolase [Candidatus Micrarchaeota archaeon]|nr:HAD family hydrolase [Candidatus Micrarchaeota archaeon]